MVHEHDHFLLTVMLVLTEGVNSDHNMWKIHVTCNVTCASRAFTNYLCTEQRFCCVPNIIVCVRVLVMPGRLAYASTDPVFTFHTSFQNIYVIRVTLDDSLHITPNIKW